ncbi:MAG: radical SAM family heme chaperone HemW [Kiritimatiellae bacterium]|jgi:oxygen-independent coproporphyrinogen-3 oxidase|nr:radical SAM family heme chaperone HemW [Kiritimatiellia bacterium]MDD2347114.1 radical SAM family heme chaperone HemW [Kiritimatiellia bacterium]MDD3583682.1 radical SAM family heme chaperone HemW [Kiritimatiellia bacterium]HHU14372.1 radical SAM family heme chaperone HemW [Lentisphaerota bacterium]HON46323.1 radical SAM family heme chaperone HemW [Kiritimatiellia bacterium]
MPSHLYIHVPFCDGKCHYCGFFSVVAAPSVIELYNTLPAREYDCRLTRLPELGKVPLRTLYMGGGTPAMLGNDGLKRLADALSKRLPFDTLEEWTVEVTPTSASVALFATLATIGVNRISIGVQSFDDTILSRIGRRHDAQAAITAVKRAQDAGFVNTGIDLIAGLPGVTPTLWSETLERAISLSLTHLSVYALIVESGTPLARQVEDGLELPGDDDQLAALAQAETALGEAGFARYEISNYALPGFECRHNLAVWRGHDFLGLGPSAASRVGRMRWTNSEDLEEYIHAVKHDAPPPADSTALDAVEDAEERVIFALRLSEGIDLAAEASRFPALAGKVGVWEQRLADLVVHGITERVGDRWRLTARGREVCDAVLRELV